MRNLFKYILILLTAALSACSKDVMLQQTQKSAESGGKFVIFASDYMADWTEPGTKSLYALGDNLQKQIHNLYYFFYDGEGYLERVFYQDVDPTMNLVVYFDDFKEDGVTVDHNGHIFIIANSQKMSVAASNDGKPVLVSSEKVTVGDINAWKQSVATVSDFKKQALFPLFIPHAVEGVQGGNIKHGRPDHVIMLGFFDGSLDDKSIQVPLGRLCARMQVSLSGPGLGQQARVTLDSVALYTSVYPEIEGGQMPCKKYNPDNLDLSTFWGSFVETIDNQEGGSDDNTLATDLPGPDGWYGGINETSDGRTADLFFYCGENDHDYTKTVTRLKVETWDTKVKPDAGGNRTGKPDRTYTIDLGQQSPYIENRSLSLYRNTSYTFNIELKLKSN